MNSYAPDRSRVILMRLKVSIRLRPLYWGGSSIRSQLLIVHSAIIYFPYSFCLRDLLLHLYINRAVPSHVNSSCFSHFLSPLCLSLVYLSLSKSFARFYDLRPPEPVALYLGYLNGRHTQFASRLRLSTDGHLFSRFCDLTHLALRLFPYFIFLNTFDRLRELHLYHGLIVTPPPRGVVYLPSVLPPLIGPHVISGPRV